MYLATRRRNQFGKDLVTGSYDLIVLDVLCQGRAYGYEIKRRIWKQSKGTVLWRDGTIYNVLHHLEKQRLVTSQLYAPKIGHSRRYYRLTERGKQIWRLRRTEWIAFSKMLNALLGG